MMAFVFVGGLARTYSLMAVGQPKSLYYVLIGLGLIVPVILPNIHRLASHLPPHRCDIEYCRRGPCRAKRVGSSGIFVAMDQELAAWRQPIRNPRAVVPSHPRVIR